MKDGNNGRDGRDKSEMGGTGYLERFPVWEGHAEPRTVQGVTEVRKAKVNGDWRDDYMTMEMREREIREEERENGIMALVSTLKEMNVPIQTILEKVQEKFSLSLETAKKYV